MSYSIIGESIKSALSIKLGEIFPNITRYKESITNLKYPHFFIYQTSLDVLHEEKNRYHLNYLINIRYRFVEDIETATNLQQQLDDIGLKLLSDLDYINLSLDETVKPVRILNPRFEKADGVLQFFCNILVRAKKPEIKDPEMKDLNIEEGVN